MKKTLSLKSVFAYIAITLIFAVALSVTAAASPGEIPTGPDGNLAPGYSEPYVEVDIEENEVPLDPGLFPGGEIPKSSVDVIDGSDIYLADIETGVSVFIPFAALPEDITTVYLVVVKIIDLTDPDIIAAINEALKEFPGLIQSAAYKVYLFDQDGNEILFGDFSAIELTFPIPENFRELAYFDQAAGRLILLEGSEANNFITLGSYFIPGIYVTLSAVSEDKNVQTGDSSMMLLIVLLIISMAGIAFSAIGVGVASRIRRKNQ